MLQKQLKNSQKVPKSVKNDQNILDHAQNVAQSKPKNTQGSSRTGQKSQNSDKNDEYSRSVSCPQPESTSQSQVNSWVYSDLVKEHFLNPRNFLMGDEAQFSYDATGIVGNPICGDQMQMFLRIQDYKITDVRWKTYGCASAIASTSALSELVKGKTLDEALEVGPEEITEYLGGLPKHKFHCSVLGHEALAAAIKDYRNRDLVS